MRAARELDECWSALEEESSRLIEEADPVYDLPFKCPDVYVQRGIDSNRRIGDDVTTTRKIREE